LLDGRVAVPDNTEMAHSLDHIRVDRTVFSVAKLTDRPDEIDFWRRKTPDERLAGAELMRQMAYGYDPATARLQRFFEVVECAWS
jgi:hypothetical protein